MGSSMTTDTTTLPSPSSPTSNQGHSLTLGRQGRQGGRQLLPMNNYCTLSKSNQRSQPMMMTPLVTSVSGQGLDPDLIPVQARGK